MKIFIFSLLKLCLGKYENYADGMRIYVHEDDEFLVERGTHVLGSESDKSPRDPKWFFLYKITFEVQNLNDTFLFCDPRV
jgi:hypothetical protein